MQNAMPGVPLSPLHAEKETGGLLAAARNILLVLKNATLAAPRFYAG